MEEAFDTVVRRQSQTSVIDRKRADETLKPFMGALKGWNAKAAHLRGVAESTYSSAEDKQLARAGCRALLVEVRLRRDEFLSAIEGEPPHGRLDDMAAAFEQLIGRLEEISGGAADSGLGS